MDILLLIGLALVLGYAGGKLGNRFKFPSVVGYIMIGLILGPSFLNIFNNELVGSLGIISDVALGLVAFTIGSEMRSGVLRRQGKGLYAIIFCESFAAFFIVAISVYLLTHKLYLALLFGAMAPASAPAGTIAVLQECKAKGPLTSTLISVVGLDDGLAIIIYGFASVLAKTMITSSGNVFTLKTALFNPALEIVGSLAVGSVVAVVFTYFVRKTHRKAEILIMSLGAIFLCTGLSNTWHLSLILTNLALGIVMANMYLHTSRKVFNAIQDITAPIYVIFFVLAGAHLQIKLLPAMGFVGLVYIIGRIVGLMGGAYLGATIGGAEDNVRKYLGLGILSQAGVAIGLALIVVREFSPLGPEGAYVASLVINTIAATTIVFEIIGPITTKIAIERSGEAGKLKR